MHFCEFLIEPLLVVFRTANLEHALGFVPVLDGLVDVLYVTIGTALSYGLGHVLMPAFFEVHKNNMSKLGPDGKPIKDASGKVVKPEGYVPVDLKPLLETTERKLCVVCKKHGTYACPKTFTNGNDFACEELDEYPDKAQEEAKGTCGICDLFESTFCSFPDNTKDDEAPVCFYNKPLDY